MTVYKFLVGFMLTVAMIAVLAMSSLMFSARDFQFGVAQVTHTDGLLSFDDIERIGSQIEPLRAAASGRNAETAQITHSLAALDTTQNNITATRASLVRAISEIEGRLNMSSPAGPAGPAGEATQALTQRINALDANPSLPPQDKQTVASLRSNVQQLGQQETQQQQQGDAATQRSALSTRLALVSGQAQETNQQIRALQMQVLPDNPDEFDRVHSEVRALRSLSLFGASTYLAQGSPSLLSTGLVLLMGALGSLLYLFPAYLNRPQPVTLAEIAVRLIFGMCAALAFYVLANAGIATFSLGSGQQAQSSSGALNPFMVSLIGIVAGVLSEDIAKWIQERGKGIFTPGGAAAVTAPADDANFTGVNPHGGPDVP
ncbi:MAG: hypothetical protein QM759_07245 [Terricaulis sp.]